MEFFKLQAWVGWWSLHRCRSILSYLAHKAESLGYHPQVILSGRRVNDMIGMFVANK